MTFVKRVVTAFPVLLILRFRMVRLIPRRPPRITWGQK